MADVTEFPVEYAQTLDEVVAQESFTTRYNVQGAEFVNARTVKVPEMKIAKGTTDYDKFQTKNDVTITYTTYELDMDRETAFYLDALDVQDQPLLDLVRVGSEFERVKFVPEVDKHFFGKAATAAKTNAKTDLTAANIRSELRKARTQLKQNGYNSAALYLSSDAMSCLEDSLDRTFSGEDVITDAVGRYNIFDLYEVPDDRLGVDFCVIANGERVIRNVVKRAVSKLFTPEVNQNGDGYELQMRWVFGTVALKNKNGGIYVSKGTKAPDCSVKPAKLVQTVAAGAAGGEDSGAESGA